MKIKKWISKKFLKPALQKIDDAMNIKKWIPKKFLKPALAMLRFVVENANPNVVFIGLVIFGIFWISLNWHFKCEQLKSEERIEIRKLELEAEIKIRKLELDAETQQFKRQKPKKKGLVEDANPNLVFIGLVMLGIFLTGFYWHFKCEQLKSKCEQLKSEERIEIRKLELEAEIKIRKLELDAETQQFKRQKPKKRKKKKRK